MSDNRHGCIIDRNGWKHLRFRFKDRPPVSFPLGTKDQDEAEMMKKFLGRKFNGKVNDVAALLEGMAKQIRDGADVAVQDEKKAPLSGAWRLYVNSRKRPPSGQRTLSAYSQQLEAFSKWYGKDRAMNEVGPADAEGYAQHLDGEHSSGTVNKHLAFLRLFWRVVLPGAENPWVDVVSQNNHASVRHRAFTTPQLKDILNRPGAGDFADLQFVLAYTGLRLGDAACLPVEDVLFDRGVIDTLPKKTSNRGNEPMRARIGIHPTLLPILKARCAGRHSGPVFPALAALYARDPTKLTDDVRANIELCGITTQTEPVCGRRRTLYSAHSFRHTLQTALVNVGVHPFVADLILAHKDTSMGSHYSHITDAQVIDAIGKALPDLKTERGVVIQMEQAV